MERHRGSEPRTPSDPAWRVLVVDDDAAVGRAILRVLRPLQVTFAQSPAGALARIEAGGKFEAIVCDVNMPGMSGPQLQHEVARIAPHLASRFVFITGGAFTEELTELLECSANECVEKPFDPDALRAAVATIAGRPLPAEALPASR